jgi:uncharacterized membrane protein YgcG
MNRLAALGALVLASTISTLPAAARDFVQDQAGMFSSGTVAALNGRIGNFNAQTGKEVVVVTVPALGASTVADAAAAAFSQQRVDGVLVFVARDDRRDIIVPDRAGAQAGWFTPDVLKTIRSSMESQFRAGDYDAGITTAVDGILNIYRAHVGNSRAANSNAAGAPTTSRSLPSTGGIHISMFWWIVIIVVGFLILRSLMRAFSSPRYGPPGTPPGALPPGGTPGPYGPGYGGGYGGGGGSFWSGLLGGLGGAWLGNEMFGGRGGGGAIGPADAGQAGTPDAGGGWGGDTGGGMQSDAGQADMGGASGGDWSGGGFGGDGGGGDFGGGDSGGGGGDSGGGW